jgi:hypothetical protein
VSTGHACDENTFFYIKKASLKLHIRCHLSVVRKTTREDIGEEKSQKWICNIPQILTESQDT